MPENVSGTQSYARRHALPVPAVATAVDLNTPVHIGDFAGHIAQVTYVPTTTLTGANTNSRTITIVNETQGKTAATLAFVSGVNATGLAATDIPVSGTLANTAVAVGDVISIHSTHIGTGLADPGGLLKIRITRD